MVVGCCPLTGLMQSIEQIAKYEFLTKPSGGICLINSGIPESHKLFWSGKIAEYVQLIYQHAACYKH